MSLRNVQQNNVGKRTLKVPVTSQAWVRNPTWAALPSITSSDEKFVGLYAVDVDSSFIAVAASTSSGTYHVDWGDGTTSDTASNSTSYHQYTFTDSALANTDGPVTFTDSGDLVSRTAHGYTNGMTISFATITSTTGISVGQTYYVINANANDFQLSSTPGGSAITLTTDGSGTILPYKQALVTITCNTGGATLTGLNLNLKHSTSGLNAYATGWLDIALSMTGGSTLTIGGTTVYNSRLQRCDILKSGITTSTSLFANCYSLVSIPNFSTGTLTNTSSMFNGCTSLTSVPLFNTASVTNMSFTFSGCTSLTSVPLFNTASVTNMSFTFNGCTLLTSVPLFNTAACTNMSSMFNGCSSLTSVPLFNTAACIDANNMFFNCISLTSVPLFNTAACTNMSAMFRNCRSLTSVPLFNTAACTNTSYFIGGCTSLTSVPLFNTAASTDTSSMFNGCTLLTSVPLFNTAACTNMSSMFNGCSSLTSVPLFNTASVTNMSFTFSGCTLLTSVPLFNTASVTNMSGMFNGCTLLTSVPLFNTAACTNMSSMFSPCISLTSVPLFNTAACTNMSSMFNGCTSLITVPALDCSHATSSSGYTNMFSGDAGLAQINCTGHKYTFTVAGCKLSSTALNTLYTNLGTVTGQTITVSSNYGTSGDDPTIATGKGWTVTGS